ncbi:MAG: hypothetical protein VZR53_08455 [Prevotella sp.]|nr:hypothetical protein [Prevotella sp.]
MKKVIEKFKKLSLPMKIQLIIALISTAAIPVYAWFAYQDKIEIMSKVKEPPSINLASGGDDPALYISLENIDVSSDTEKYIVFSVEPGKYSAYDIQLSHTTNIPFTYELYRVMEDENGSIEYTDHTRNVDAETGLNVETIIHYSIMNTINDAITNNGKINLTEINPDTTSSSRTLGNESVLAVKNYAVEDEVNQYVKPLYSIARVIPQLNENTDRSKDRDYFVIKLTWQTNSNINEENLFYWDYAFNNKETDIIYISAKQNTYTEDTPSP